MLRQTVGVILEAAIKSCDRALKIHDIAIKSAQRSILVHKEAFAEWNAVRRELREELEQLTPVESVEAFRRSSQILEAAAKEDKESK